MKLAVGCDHAGVELAQEVERVAQGMGLVVQHVGSCGEACDYPGVAFKVARGVAAGEFQHGVLICGTGLGMSYVANKVPGIRAALCSTCEAAVLARSHNDANILVMPGRDGRPPFPGQVLRAWLMTRFSGEERHRRRLQQIRDIEQLLAARPSPCEGMAAAPEQEARCQAEGGERDA